MSTFLEAVATHSIILYALIAGIVASIAGGIIGSYVVVKRISFIAGSISHSIVAGIGFFLWLERAKGMVWASPLEGALIAGILSALLIGWIHMYRRQREDSVIATIWSFGMALGLLFISQTPGFNVELTNYLIGNILWTTPEDIVLLGILDAVVLITVCLLHQKLLALSFDEDQARLQGIKVNQLYLLLLSLIAITTVLLMQVVGIILVMTMLTIPSNIANLFTKKLGHMMVLSVILSMLFCFFGMVISFQLDLPAGATIAFVSTGCYMVVLLFRSKESFS